jgi:hypothetical protein
MRVAANILQFQIAWFACVLGAAHGRPVLGAGIAITLAALHIVRSRRAAQELGLALFAAMFGFSADTALVQLGVLSFTTGTIVAGTAPFWMVALWTSFATTLNVSLTWLGRRLALAALLGAVGGPAAYYAGAQLGAVQLTPPLHALPGVGAMWAIAMPVLLLVARRIARPSPEPARQYA